MKMVLIRSVAFFVCIGNVFVFVDTGQCPVIAEAGRAACPGVSQSECESRQCCWDEDASQEHLKCFHKECKRGYFGYRCQFQCNCKDEGSCDSVTGDCHNMCDGNSWGVGCLLESDCTYNDRKGQAYMGKVNVTEDGYECGSWTSQRAYVAVGFPEKSLELAGSYCRNPYPHDQRAWCYYTLTGSTRRQWGDCSLRQCECVLGRYGVNCEEECHCMDPDEQCHQTLGTCRVSGCDHNWTGDDCQECLRGRFGTFCEKVCHCHGDDLCDPDTGRCPQGCAASWYGADCQQECRDGFFGRDCAHTCNCHYLSEVCDKKTGHCNSGCKDGFAGDDCTIEIPSLSRPPRLVSRDLSLISIAWEPWSNPPDGGDGQVNSYLVYYRAGEAMSWITQHVPPESTQLELSDLDAGQLYHIRVVPIHEDGIAGIGSPPLNTSTCGRPLTGPRDVRVEQRPWSDLASSSSDSDEDIHPESCLFLSWTLPDMSQWGCDSVSNFNVYILTHGEFTLLKGTTDRNMSFCNYSPLSNLTLGVSLVNTVNLESDIVTDSFVGKSGAVREFTAEPLSAQTLLIRWQPPEQPNGDIQVYILRYKPLREGNCKAMTDAAWSPRFDIVPSETSRELIGLHPYSSYLIKIWAETSAGKGVTDSVTGYTEAAAPSTEITNFKYSNLDEEKAFFSWDPVPCESQNGQFVGYKYLLHNLDRDVIEQANSGDNFTEMWLSNLRPFTDYEIRLRFVNHHFGGPASSLTFKTLESTPSTPTNLMCVEGTSETLNITWQSPEHPNGHITRYDIKYSLQSSTDAVIIERPPTAPMSFKLTNLTADTQYFIRIRAYTKIGPGPWSETVVGVTYVELPSQPQNFMNTSRSSTTLSFSWDPPSHAKGALLDYKIICYVYEEHTVSNPVRKIVTADMTEVIMDGLYPGTCYRCDVQTRTQKGYGPAHTTTCWTKPEILVKPVSPVLVEARVTDSTVEVIIEPVTLDMTVEKSVYQVIVEHVGDGAGRTRREPSVSPCGMPSHSLTDYYTALRSNNKCYITAQFIHINYVRNFQVSCVQVGDNRTYGGFYNAPLQKGEEYDVWYGVEVTVDGEIASSYSKTEASIISGEIRDPGTLPPESSNASVLAGAGIGAALVIVLIIFVVYFFFIRKRKQGRDLLAFEVTESETLRSSPRCVVNPDKMRQSIEPSETEPLYSNADVIKKVRTPIPVEHLWNFVREKKQSATDSLTGEYDELPQGLTAKCEVARRIENKLKNRYGNIVAYDHSRVKLEVLPADPCSDYINANFIDAYRKPNAFIATQGPSKATMSDIWRLAWERNSHRIIMVTNLVEDGRSPKQSSRKSLVQTASSVADEHKCEQYWPEADEKLYGEITVRLVDTEQFADYVIRTFSITKGAESKPLRQFHFTAWPDHGVPVYATSLLAFLRKVRSFDDAAAGPSIIHCSAGVGRTGTFIALDYLLDQARTEGQVDVYHCVQNMRTKRVNMVQTYEQYLFVYEALIEALKSGDTSIPCVDFRKRYSDLQKVNADTGKIKLQEEFELLAAMASPIKPAGCRDATSEENSSKNRHKDIVPLDNTVRPYIMTYVPGSTDYINAVFTDGYKQRECFIATQTPLPHTVTDFWCMMYDHDCKTVVMLHPPDPSDPTIGRYFPSETGSLLTGPFTVETVSIDTSEKGIIVRDFTLTYNKRGSNHDPRFIRHFQFEGWSTGDSLPVSRHSLIALLGLLEKWQQRSGNGPVTVHCMDGASRTGLFCAVSYMLERLKVEQEVDVFQSVKHTRINRPQFISNLELYQFVYDMAVEYMDAFETYANFK